MRENEIFLYSTFYQLVFKRYFVSFILHPLIFFLNFHTQFDIVQKKKKKKLFNSLIY